MASLIGGVQYGVAKGVNIGEVNVLSCGTFGDPNSLYTYSDWVVGALNWVTAQHNSNTTYFPNVNYRDVINMSLIIDNGSLAVDSAVNRAIDAGIVVVTGAGNSATNVCTVASPQRVPRTLVAEATTFADERWFAVSGRGSNTGTCVDLHAPGVEVIAARVRPDNPNGDEVWTGTSFAAPHVAGAAALYLTAFPTATPTEAANALVSNATTGLITGLPADTQNRLLYTRFFSF